MTDDIMTEDVAADTAADLQVTPRKGVFSFQRKVSIRDYENASAFCSIEFPIDWDDEPEDIIRKAQEAASQVKSLVFEQLGLPFTTDDDGILLEAVERAVPAQQMEQYAPYAEPQNTQAAGDNPPYAPTTTDKGEKAANEAWGKQRFQTHPHEFWDNRGTKTNPRAPDAKHKRTQMPVWRLS